MKKIIFAFMLSLFSIQWAFAAFPEGSSLQSLAGRADVKFYVWQNTSGSGSYKSVYVYYKGKYYSTNVIIGSECAVCERTSTGLTRTGQAKIDNYRLRQSSDWIKEAFLPSNFVKKNFFTSSARVEEQTSKPGY